MNPAQILTPLDWGGSTAAWDNDDHSCCRGQTSSTNPWTCASWASRIATAINCHTQSTSCCSGCCCCFCSWPHSCFSSCFAGICRPPVTLDGNPWVLWWGPPHVLPPIPHQLLPPVCSAAPHLHHRGSKGGSVINHLTRLWLLLNRPLQFVFWSLATTTRPFRFSFPTSQVLDRKRVDYPLQVGGEFLPQVEVFKYHRVLFMNFA